MGDRISSALMKMPFVRSVAQRVGRAEVSADVFGTQYSEFEVDLKPDLSARDSDHAQDEIQTAAADIPGAHFAMNTFLTERIEETISG
jgi:Cu/Ag efflux pump CusA